ncbi:hypothetical protein PR048_019337 [Dryococelus australis]|uniref:Uncharacterized protein n=1 Tax=Dryococelus australis TaxID=614101 RepID=A0ABQ9H3J9_9NEOP|nr:hypothetical protein PR048_019337 [Dryococelus australis]
MGKQQNTGTESIAGYIRKHLQTGYPMHQVQHALCLTGIREPGVSATHTQSDEYLLQQVPRSHHQPYCIHGLRATVAERLAHSPPTKANRVQSLAVFSHVGIVPDDTVGRRIISGISRFPAPSFQHHSIFYSITLIGSQDLAAAQISSLNHSIHMTSNNGTNLISITSK